MSFYTNCIHYFMNHIYMPRFFKTFVQTLCLFVFLCIFSYSTKAQLNVFTGYTATQLAQKLAGPGVIILAPTLTCADGASGEFKVVESNLGIDCGVIMTTGQVQTTATTVGVDDAASNFASTGNGTPGDAELTALAGLTTYDACILEFNFVPSGSTISFNYVFGSEEYTDYACTEFNDVFGFFISGPTYATPTNIALVPGTSIPVCINSVNCGATGSGTLSTCTALGAGSPFCAYYVNNSTGTSVVYDGLTTVLTAQATVTPCDTYHLKLGVADASDDVYDSGVFLEAGSLSSIPSTVLSAIGIGGIPYAIRGCAPGVVNFTTASQCTPTVIKYVISGTAVNGYDYSTIPDSVIIPAYTTTASVNITPLPLPPGGPKTVTITVLKPDHCNPDSLIADPTETASLTIYDSFHLHIVTPDTSICIGDNVNVVVTPDSVFGSIMNYVWTPSGGLSSSTALDPVASPTVTTTYQISGNVSSAVGCPAATDQFTIKVYNKPVLTTDSPLIKTCVGIPVQLNIYAAPDTIAYTYLWSPATDLSSTTISDPVVTPTAAGNVSYTPTVTITALPDCYSTIALTVHTEPNDFTLTNGDTVICLGNSVQVNASGSNAFTYSWTPPTGVSNTTIINPLITPPVATAPDSVFYTVTATYAACPPMIHSFSIMVDTPAPPIVFTDTICLGVSQAYNVTVAGGAPYQYLWTSSTGATTYLNSNTIPDPVSTPTITGTITYTVTISLPNVVGCANFDIANLFVVPNTVTISTPDTAICAGNSVQIIAVGDPLFTYQWRPTAGIASYTVISPLITPDTSATYILTASFHSCPDMRDSIRIDVQPRPSIFMGFNRSVCEHDTLNIRSTVTPMWYSGYTYTWSPATNLDNTTASGVIYTGTAADTTMLYLTVNTPVSLTTDTTCRATDSIQIITHTDSFEAPLPDLNFCPGQTAIVAPSGDPASFHWYPSLYVSDSLSGSPTIHPITSLEYTVVATSIYGCNDTLSFSATVHPAGLIEIGPDSVTLYPGETYALNPETNCTSFAWFPPAGLSDPLISNPVASPEVSTEYYVTGTTSDGCVATDSINIFLDPQSLLSLPNAFTPGTGSNSEYKIIKRGIATLNYFRIFNRWGNKVFETTDINQGWDGQWNGTPQPFGVYVYEVEAVTSAGKNFVKHGNLTLIK